MIRMQTMRVLGRKLLMNTFLSKHLTVALLDYYLTWQTECPSNLCTLARYLCWQMQFYTTINDVCLWTAGTNTYILVKQYGHRHGVIGGWWWENLRFCLQLTKLLNLRLFFSFFLFSLLFQHKHHIDVNVTFSCMSWLKLSMWLQ